MSLNRILNCQMQQELQHPDEQKVTYEKQLEQP